MKTPIQRRMGKGTPAFKRPSHRFKVMLNYSNLSGKGYVEDLVEATERTGVLMKVRFENNEQALMLAPRGINTNSVIEISDNAEPRIGNILPLEKIPDGSEIYNIELKPGDGGKLVRAAGTCAYVIAHEKEGVKVLLPSKKIKIFNPKCRAQIGRVAGSGRNEAPLMKAGKNYYRMHALNRIWPKNRYVKTKFGGKEHHRGKSSMVSRNAPPGAKHGHIAARRVGRRKR
ncbi:MAG: 50S ribosomal protein L2 [Candidatus Micrarchaeia archaeon]